MQPSDSLVCVGLGYGCPLPSAYPRRRLLLRGAARGQRQPAARASADTRRVGEWSPGPRSSGRSRGQTWASQVTGSSSSRAPQSATPLVRCVLAVDGRSDAAFRIFDPMGIQDLHGFRGCTPRLTCSRAYASPPPSRETAQGSLPACWLSFDRAGFAPAGRQIRISSSFPLLTSSFLTTLPSSHPT